MKSENVVQEKSFGYLNDKQMQSLLVDAEELCMIFGKIQLSVKNRNLGTPKNTLRHCGLDPQSSAKMLFTSGLRVKPAMTEMRKIGFFRGFHL